MVLDDKTGAVLQAVTFDKPISAGDLNTPEESHLEWEFDEDTFDKIFSADAVIMTASFSTESVTTPVKIYSSMGIDMTLSVRFGYLLKLKRSEN